MYPAITLHTDAAPATADVPRHNPPPDALTRLFAESVFGMPPWMLAARMSDFSRGGVGVPLGVATGTPSDRKAGRDVPLFWSELDLRGYRILARHITDTNPFGKGFVKLLTNYHVRKGFGWKACKRGVRKSPYPTATGPVDPVVAKGQQILDDFQNATKWPLKSREAFRRWCRDGEVIGRFFFGGQGRVPDFRFGSPDALGSPTGNNDDDDSFGIETPKNDPAGPHLAYHFFEPDGIHGEWVPGDRVVFAKRNTDDDVKRGLPDFHPVAAELEDCTALVRSMLATAIRQSKTAWIEKFPNRTGPIVSGAVPEFAGGTGYSGQARAPFDGPLPWWLMPQVGGGLNPWEPPGVIRKVEGDREYQPGPASNPTGYISVEQAALRGCGVIWSFPEYFSGDASNANMASTFAAGTPFTVEVESSQYEFGATWERPCALKVLELARDAGLLSREEWQQLDVEVTEPAVVIADPGKDTDVVTKQLQSKIVSLDTARQKLGYDPQHEAEGVKKDAAAEQPNDATNPTDSDDTVPPDSGDDLTALFGEARVVRNDGDTWQVGGNWYTKAKGKIRKTTDPSKKRDKAPTKADAARAAKAQKAANQGKAQAAAHKLAAGSGLTHDDVRDLDDHFQTLTQDRMKEVARALGAKLSGTKKELAARLVAQAKLLVRAPGPESLTSGHPAQQKIAAALAAAPGLTDQQREKYGKAMARATEHMPAAALERIGTLNGITFHPSTKDIPAAIVEQLASRPGLTPEQQAEIRAKYAHVLGMPVGGAYMTGGVHHVHVDGDNVGGSRGRHSAGFSQAHGIYAHELTHTIDGPRGEISSGQAWHNAFEREMKVTPGRTPPLTNYAGTKPSEAFAEFGRLVYGSDVPHAQIATEFPYATAVFKAYKLWPEKERTASGGGIKEVFGQRVEVGTDGSHGDVLLKTPAKESVQDDEYDPAVVAFALATLRAEGDDEAAAELVAEFYGDDEQPVRESVQVVEHGPPPFPGAVLMGDPPRWHHPVTGDEHPADAEHPHDEQAAGSADHDHAPAEDKGRFAKVRAALAQRLNQTAGGRAVVKMGTGGLWLFHKLEHKLLFVAKKTQEVAARAAAERGLPEEKIPALKRALYIADFIGGYATGGAALAVAGPLAGKVVAVMPSASVAYLAYSTAKDPAATWRAAKAVIAETLSGKGPAHESVAPELVARLTDAIKAAADPDWFLALFHAALGATDGDVDRAIEVATETAKKGR